MELIRKVSKHPITGQRRAIRLKEIAYINFDIKECKIFFEEMVLDEADKPIKSNLVPTRTIAISLSDTNKVNNEGITITKEFIQASNPILEAETEEEYNLRIDTLLEESLKKGNPEFSFYVTNILNLNKIAQAVQLLDSLKRFDRE
jgi:hypothetical protein